jgi:cardiolipin synthase
VCQLSSEATYAELIDGGVEVWNFGPSMLHAKVLTVDGSLAVLGSSNFNRRSMNHDEEIALAIFDDEAVEILDGHFEEDLKQSRPIDLDRWRERRRSQKLLESAVQPIRRWL